MAVRSYDLHGEAIPPSNEQVAKSTNPPTMGIQSIVMTRVSAISKHSSVGVSGPVIISSEKVILYHTEQGTQLEELSSRTIFDHDNDSHNHQNMRHA